MSGAGKITQFFGSSSSKRPLSGVVEGVVVPSSAASGTDGIIEIKPGGSPKRQKVIESVESTPGAKPWGAAFTNLHSSWKTRLEPEFKKTYMQRLVTFLDSETSKHTVYPPINQVWTAFDLCPFDSVKVVCIGQDPYHGPNQAHGLAFSVAKGIQIPPSLRNMITEANRDPAVAIPKPLHGSLECWAKQGVLLLNTCLTVRKAEANSHQKQGWEDFTDAVVRELGRKEGIVYLLWGSPAQAKCKAIDAKKNRIIKS
jgi:uracil-DNA glycosylase